MTAMRSWGQVRVGVSKNQGPSVSWFQNGCGSESVDSHGFRVRGDPALPSEIRKFAASGDLGKQRTGLLVASVMRSAKSGAVRGVVCVFQ